MERKSLVRRVGLGLALCLGLVGVYAAGMLVTQSTASPGVKTEIGHSVQGDPLAGLELDAAQYGTETPEEREAIGDCYESRVGARAPEELATPSYDDLFAWRECAVKLGIESKVMMIESATDEERSSQAAEANEQIRKQKACLEELGWKTIPLPDSRDGVINFRVDAAHDSDTVDRLAADSEACGVSSADGHDH